MANKLIQLRTHWALLPLLAGSLLLNLPSWAFASSPTPGPTVDKPISPAKAPLRAPEVPLAAAAPPLAPTLTETPKVTVKAIPRSPEIFAHKPSALAQGPQVALPKSAESAPAKTAPAPSAPKLVTNLWVDTDLRQVIQDISSQTDVVIVCDQTVGGLLSMSIKDMPMEEALERACASGGYSFIKVKDYYLIGKAEPGNPIFQRLSEPQRVKLSYIQADQVKGLLHPSLNPYVSFDKVSGTVVVTAPEPTRQRIIDSIKQIDQPSRQVAIEAVVFELTEDGSKQLAMDWKFKSPNFSTSSQNLVNTFSYNSLSDMGVSVDMTLRAIVESRRGQVLANPRIMVLNNTEAEIFVGQEKYYSLLSGQAANPYYTLQSIKAGVTLKVLPYIGDDGQITLDLEPEVSDVITDNSSAAAALTSGGTPMPVVTRRHAKTVVNMRDGQTVLIGGLLMDSHRNQVGKIPGLGDVPLAGAPFRSVNDTRTQQEVVILITAHLADNRNIPRERVTPRLTQRYVSPLDAIGTPQHGGKK